MKHLKKFNEAVSSNSELEEKLKTIIDSIKRSNWAPISEWNFQDKEIDYKKDLFDIEIENIRFEKCENKLNKLCYDFTGVSTGNVEEWNSLSIDGDKLYDIQVTYDNRGIIVMSGLLTDNPKILDIFHKDVSIYDIELQIVSKIMENIIKYSEIEEDEEDEIEENEEDEDDDEEEVVYPQVSNNEPKYHIIDDIRIPKFDGTQRGVENSLKIVDKLSSSQKKDLERRDPQMYRKYIEEGDYWLDKKGILGNIKSLFK